MLRTGIPIGNDYSVAPATAEDRMTMLGPNVERVVGGWLLPQNPVVVCGCSPFRYDSACCFVLSLLSTHRPLTSYHSSSMFRPSSIDIPWFDPLAILLYEHPCETGKRNHRLSLSIRITSHQISAFPVALSVRRFDIATPAIDHRERKPAVSRLCFLQYYVKQRRRSLF